MNRKKTSTGTSFIENDKGLFEVEAEVEFSKEIYGADADGNRGILQYFHEVIEVVVYAESGGVIAEDEYKEYFSSSDLDKAVESAVESAGDNII